MSILPNFLRGFVVDALDVGGYSDIALHADDLALGLGADGLHRRIERLPPARSDRNVGAGGGEARRDRVAEAL